MAQLKKLYFNHRPPTPSSLDDDAAVVAYSTAFAAWRVDREAEGAWDRIALVEGEPDHQAAIARAAEIAS